MRWYILSNDRISTNAGVVPYSDRPDQFCARADVNMSANGGDPVLRCSNGDLMENQAIYANLCLGMNDDPIGVRKEQPTADRRVYRDVCACDD